MEGCGHESGRGGGLVARSEGGEGAAAVAGAGELAVEAALVRVAAVEAGGAVAGVRLERIKAVGTVDERKARRDDE